jgi:hypothetical protein
MKVPKEVGFDFILGNCLVLIARDQVQQVRGARQRLEYLAIAASTGIEDFD